MQDSLSTYDWKAILESLPCYVTLQDDKLRVLWSNGLHQQHFGPPNGKTCRKLYNIPKSQCMECIVKKTFEDGQVHSRELQLTPRNQSRVNVLAYSSPLYDELNKMVGVIVTSVNITSVKEIQKELIMVGQTVAGMAHSIKNIMMGLDGGIYIVNSGIKGDDQKEIKDGWEIVLLNFEKLSHLVKDILYCSREREPNFKLTNPNTIVTEVYNLFKDLAARYSIDINLDLDPTLEQAVVDPEGLHTVLTNLVTNAMDACKMDLWKDTHLLEIRTRKGLDGSTIIEVADNGTGIDKSLKYHVFEDFFTSKGDKGTGLGLMVTQKIMREHGGNITFRSRPSQGTTFVVTFPPRDLPKNQS
ncbi:MAG: ATP-binding protein [Deltaproteobacteria bacterium]|nr:ATP-binding protein [Deltaproteobacteria bacterium]